MILSQWLRINSSTLINWVATHQRRLDPQLAASSYWKVDDWKRWRMRRRRGTVIECFEKPKNSTRQVEKARLFWFFLNIPYGYEQRQRRRKDSFCLYKNDKLLCSGERIDCLIRGRSWRFSRGSKLRHGFRNNVVDRKDATRECVGGRGCRHKSKTIGREVCNGNCHGITQPMLLWTTVGWGSGGYCKCLKGVDYCRRDLKRFTCCKNW